jgi:hypothetical protein
VCGSQRRLDADLNVRPSPGRPLQNLMSVCPCAGAEASCCKIVAESLARPPQIPRSGVLSVPCQADLGVDKYLPIQLISMQITTGRPAGEPGVDGVATQELHGKEETWRRESRGTTCSHQQRVSRKQLRLASVTTRRSSASNPHTELCIGTSRGEGSGEKLTGRCVSGISSTREGRMSMR